nr:hypothetical protein [Polyangiaceae bacterium]
SLNFDAASTVSNPVLVGKGKDVCVETITAAHVIVDAVGVLAPGGDSLFSVTPFRLLDSRAAIKLVANTEVEVSAAGVGSIPANVSGVALNVTATEAEQDGFLRVYPCGQANSGTASLNFRANAALGGMVFSRVGALGKVCVTSSVNTHVVMDASGGFIKNNSAIQGVKPTRIFDSRDGAGLKVAGSAGIPVVGKFGVPATATGALINLAVTAPDGPGFVTVYECGKPVPTTSNINFGAGQTIANMAVAVPNAAGELCVSTSIGTHVIADLLGYVSP